MKKRDGRFFSRNCPYINSLSESKPFNPPYSGKKADESSQIPFPNTYTKGNPNSVTDTIILITLTVYIWRHQASQKAKGLYVS